MTTEKTAAPVAEPAKQHCGYIPISLRCVPVEGLVGLDCYIDQRGDFSLYTSAATQFANDDKNRLLHEGIECLYIRKEDAGNYYRVVSDVLKKIVVNISLPVETRADFLYENASALVGKALTNCQDNDLYRQVRLIAEAIVDFYISESAPLKHIIAIMQHEENVVCHSVNVCLFSVSLSNKLKKGKDVLLDIASGALLHDLGVSTLPVEIRQAQGPLNEKQAEIHQKHVEMGVKLLQGIEGIPQEVIQIVAQHHETLDGKGYPNHPSPKDLSEPAQIVAIADVLDTLTYARLFNDGGIAWEQALHYLNDMSYSKYHAKAVRALINEMCVTLLASSLSKKLEQLSDIDWEELSDGPRRHKRHFFRSPVFVREVTKVEGKAVLSKPEKTTMTNLSRSGFGLLSSRTIKKGSSICLTIRKNKAMTADMNLMAIVEESEQNVSGWFSVGATLYKMLTKAELDLVIKHPPAD